jgi:pimeloyl-ACP methyl ester carboxylesterase
LLIGAVLAIGLPAPVPAIAEPRLPGVVTTSTAAVAGYFAQLPAARATALADQDPSAVGNLDGVPIALRYAANARVDGTAYAGRQILGFQPGSHIIEVVGDLATARHIAILVPGVGTTVGNFERGLGGVQRRAPAWHAEQLQAAAGPDTAVIAWLGYSPPSGIDRASIRSEDAQAGAGALVRFVDGLAPQCPKATITIVGHSYGTVVLGYAAAHLPDAVTDLVAIGSPGMDVSNVAGLHTTARFWAGSDPTDWTRKLPQIRILGAGHGKNPTSPGFGALPLDVGNADGHDGYFVPGTQSLASLAAVTNGTAAAAAVAA